MFLSVDNLETRNEYYEQAYSRRFEARSISVVLPVPASCRLLRSLPQGLSNKIVSLRYLDGSQAQSRAFSVGAGQHP
jgi:hypothetical protein